MKEKLMQILLKTVTFCKFYVELCIWLLIFSVGIRFFEAVLLSQTSSHFGTSILLNLTGLCYDISLYLRLGVWILPVFVAGCFISKKKTKIILRILQSLMLLLSLILIVFFSTSGYLLDKVLFTYSFKEIWNIVQSSSNSPIWVYILIIALPVLYFYLSGKKIRINRILLVIFAVFTFLSFFIFKNMLLYDEQYHIKTNKEYFLGKSVLKPAFTINNENIIDENIIEAINEFRSYFPELQFKETKFPFLYKAKYKDVLSPYFNLKTEPPNLVFIIIEGMGYDIVYDDKLMPFLDSLSKESLSWEYCLSVSARTFGVFPALFGAAPLGEKGFMEQSPFNPSHHTLLQILHQNNYHNFLFYGCNWSNFDHIDNFAQQNHMTYLKANEWDEDLREKSIGSLWGFEDHLLYLQAQRKLNQQTSNPRVDVYLTLSTHGPWEYPKKMHFQEILKNKTIQNKSLSEEQKKNIFKYININGCYFYSDWAIQQLMESYKKRDDFDNTIFIITGDHIPFAKQFGGYENYHVPLIIYSPMLQSGRKMKGVVSHRDITPTFLSLLHNNFNIKTPEDVAWLNIALDTSLKYNANTFSPLQLIDHTLGGIMYKKYIFCEEIVQELVDGIPRKVNNPEIFQQMNRLFSLYKSLDSYIFNNDALIDSNPLHKKSRKEVINFVDTISEKSHFIKKNNLLMVEGPEGHKTTLYFDNSQAYPIGFLKYDIPTNIEILIVEIEFSIYIKNDDSDKTIKVVTAVADNDQLLLYKSEELSVDKHNQWYTFKNKALCSKETLASFEGNPVYSVYLWNNQNLEGYIDDIKVKVIVD